VSDEAGSEYCHLSVSPSTTAAEVICQVLNAKNISDEQQLYSLIAVPAVGRAVFSGMH